MRFQSAQDCLDTFVYVATAQGGPRAITSEVCKKMASRPGKAEPDAKDVALDNASIRNILEHSRDEIKLTNSTSFGDFHDEINFSNEDVMIFKVDIENILNRDFDGRERMALLVYGLFGHTHAAHVLSGGKKYRDLRDYIEWAAKEAKENRTPDPSGYHKLLMGSLVSRFEDAAISAQYMRQNGSLTAVIKAHASAIHTKSHVRRLGKAA